MTFHYENMHYIENSFSCKYENFTGKIEIFLIFLLKTYSVGTRQNRLGEMVLTSTHSDNICFGSKIRKVGIPL